MDLPNNTSLSVSILRTVLYFEIFCYAPTVEELSTWLIGPLKVKIKPTTKQIIRAINNNSKLIYSHNRICTLGNNKLINQSNQRSQYFPSKINQAIQKIKLLKLIPTVKLIAVTGSVAAKSPHKNDDIDLLIVTKTNNLWTTRLIIILLTEILQVRRRPKDKEYNNKLCFNLFLDENALHINKDKQDLYTAHEILQIIPLYNKEQTYQKMLTQNLWTKKFHPMFSFPRMLDKNKNTHIKFSSKGTVESICWFIQRKYMTRLQTREVVTPQSAFFHPFDYRQFVVNSYNTKLSLHDSKYAKK